jgi:hypothetical protein
MSVLKRLGTVAAVAGLAAVGVSAMPRDANAWWRGGIWVPPVVVVAPPAYVAPPVVYPPPAYVAPPVVYPPPAVYYTAPRRIWVPAHWAGAYWVRGHWG